MTDLTNEQAINNLEFLKRHREDYHLPPIAIFAIDKGIKALESKSEAEEYRTPKKVPFERAFFDSSSGGRYGFCPTCGRIGDNQTDQYCRRCGQALDWKNWEIEE